MAEPPKHLKFTSDPTVLKFHSEPPADLPDVVIEISGVYGKHHPQAGEGWVEEFTLIPEMPAALEAHWLVTARPERNRTKYETGPIIEFVSLLIEDHPPGARNRFLTLVADPRKLIRKELLVDVMFGAVQALTDRPTGPASTSPGGQPETETGSEPDAAETEPTGTD